MNPASQQIRQFRLEGSRDLRRIGEPLLYPIVQIVEARDLGPDDGQVNVTNSRFLAHQGLAIRLCHAY